MGATGRTELLEAVLDQMDEAVAVLDAAGLVVCWNKAAEAMTGHSHGEMQARRLPEALYQIDVVHRQQAEQALAKLDQSSAGFGSAVAGYTAVARADGRAAAETELLEKPTLVQLRHHHGHRMPAMLRRLALTDGLGVRVGTALLFHSVEDADALPHGETLGGIGVRRSQAEMEDRLDEAHHRWVLTRMPYGLVWLTVDQGAVLRRTHGRDACEAMLAIIEQTLLHGMRPTEALGRWGDEEFLVLAHERSLALLVEHAQRLVGLTRAAEFRWWGDRVALSVSVGVCQASDGVTLRAMLGAAREAMQESSSAGGNGVVAKILGPDARNTLPGGAHENPQQANGRDLPPAILKVRTY